MNHPMNAARVTLLSLLSGIFGLVIVVYQLQATYRQRAASERLLAGLEPRVERLAQIRLPAGVPWRDEVIRLQARRAQVEEMITQERRGWILPEHDAWGQVPANRGDAFLELTRFAERMRAAAAAAGVQLRPDEAFGFGAFRQTGPEAERRSAVHHQRVALEQVLPIVFAARPHRLHEVARADRAIGLSPDRRRDEQKDLFRPLNPELPAALGVEFISVRVVFEGTDATLWHVLQALAASEHVAVARAVAVTRPESDSTAAPTAIFSVDIDVAKPSLRGSDRP
jgi:hypothetical protein